MARPQGGLERSLVDLAVGSHQAREDRLNALISTKSGEYTQQVQVEISGHASILWGYADIAVSWEHPFVYAPLQRDPQFERPHLSHHLEWTGSQADLVVGHAHVVSWLQSDQGWYIGAKVRVAVMAPNTEVDYSGVLHLSFQGYACPTDEELNT